MILCSLLNGTVHVGNFWLAEANVAFSFLPKAKIRNGLQRHAKLHTHIYSIVKLLSVKSREFPVL